MKIGILTAVWGRHEIFNLFANYVDRMKTIEGVEIIPVAVGSEGSVSKALCEKRGFHYIESVNDPLGVKWNNGMEYMKTFKPDYVLNMGSDDIHCNLLLEKYVQKMKEGIDFIGIIDCYFFEMTTRKLIYWKGYNNHRRGETIGMCRALSSKLLDQVGWKPWKGAGNSGLDGQMMKNISSLNYKTHNFNCLEEGIFAVDLKTNKNVTKFSAYPNTVNVNFRQMKNFIPEKEYKKIVRL